jgi:META domain
MHVEVPNPDLALLSSALERPVEGVPDEVYDQRAVGVVREDAVAVDVILETGERVAASVADGLWLAWWYEPIDVETLESFDADGNLLDSVPAPRRDDLELVGTTWQLVEVTTRDAAVLVDEPTASLRLEPGGVARIQTACTTGTATYRVVDDELVFSEVALVDGSCSSADGGDALLDVLRAGTVAQAVQREQLELSAGTTQLVFVGE